MIDKNLRKIAPTGLRDPGARKKLEFFVPGDESASKLIASARFQTPRGTPKKLPFFMGTFLGTFWALPGRSWGHRDIFGVPRGVRKRAGTINFDAPDRPWESLGRFGRPESILGAILGRFWMPQGTPGSDFALFFDTDFHADLSSVASLLSTS